MPYSASKFSQAAARYSSSQEPYTTSSPSACAAAIRSAIGSASGALAGVLPALPAADGSLAAGVLELGAPPQPASTPSSIDNASNTASVFLFIMHSSQKSFGSLRIPVFVKNILHPFRYFVKF